MDASNMDSDNQNDQDDKEQAYAAMELEQEKTEYDNDMTDLHMEVTEEASTVDDDDETDSYSDNGTVNADHEERDLKDIPQTVAPEVASSAGGFTSLNGTSANAVGGVLFDPAQIKQEATDEDSEETEVEHDSDNETDRLPTSNELQQQLVCVLSSVGVEMPEIKEEPPEETTEVGQTISAPTWTPPSISMSPYVSENVEPSASEIQSLYHECRRLATGVDNRPSANMRRRTRSQTQVRKKKPKVCVAIGPRTMCAVCNSPCRFTKNSQIPNLPVCQTCKRSYFYEQSRPKNEREKCPNNGKCVIDYREEPCAACHLKKFQEIMKAQTRAFKGKQAARATRKAKAGQRHPMTRRNKPPVRYTEHIGKGGDSDSKSSSTTDSASETEEVFARRRINNTNRHSMNKTNRITRSVYSTSTSSSPAFPNLQDFGSPSTKPTLPQTSTSAAEARPHLITTNLTESSLNNMKMFIYTCEHTCSHCANSQNGQVNSDQSSDTKSSFSSSEHSNIISSTASEESLRSAILVKLNEIAQLMRVQTKTEPPVPSPAANASPTIRFLNSKTVIDLNAPKGQPSGISSLPAPKSRARSLLSTVTNRAPAPNLHLLSASSVTTASAQSALRSAPSGPEAQTGMQPLPQSSGLGNINLSLGPPTMLAVAPQGNSLGVGLAMSAAQPTQINLQSPRVSISAPFVALPRYLLLPNHNN